MGWWGNRRSVAVTGNIGNAVTGDGNQIVNHFLPALPARSAYWERVRELAPTELVGRERELVELAAFCAADSGQPYAWWRAEAWAGKSALMSWFALHPPPGIRVASFFVTARDGGYNHRGPFVDSILEQLAELVGESLPGPLGPSTRHGQLLRLYREAARACARRGERLVLLVDGLDEDRGVTTGHEAYSIASLLPTRLEAGMRVLVTGRLNPPLPSDVPLHHPLRDSAVVRTLEPSPYAQVVRTEAERELKRLRAAGGLEYQLLALVTAAQGGLTVADLVELTGVVPYDVRNTLDTYAGRTFRARGPVCLLAHEALQAPAEEILGDAELARFRAGLHTWAEHWRARGWPTGTPDYLLRGYFQMMHETGDTARLVRCATDGARHDRMLAVTGADGSALEEIRVAERLLTEISVPKGAPGTEGAEAHPLSDVVLSHLRLCVHGDAIRDRMRDFTESFAWGWAALGQPSRAEAVARSLVSMHQVPALALVAQELAEQGLTKQGAELATAAERALRQEGFWHRAAEHSVVVHRALVGVGMYDRADAVLRSNAHPCADSQPAPRVVRTWVDRGEFERARAVVMEQTNPSHRSACLRSLVTALLANGQIGPAWEAVREAGDAAPSSAVLRLALALSDADRLEEAEALQKDARPPGSGFWERSVDLSEAAADVADYFGALAQARRWDVLCDMFERISGDKTVVAKRIRDAMAPWLVRWGDLDVAEAMVIGWSGDDVTEAACLLADALARRGEVQRVRRLADSLRSDTARSKALASAAGGFAATGRLREAESFAALTGLRHALDPLVRGAVARARSGHHEEGEAFLVRLEDRVRGEAGVGGSVSDRARVAQALANAGYSAAAREVLAGIEDALARKHAMAEPYGRYGYDLELSDAVRALVCSGEIGRAEALIRGPGGFEQAQDEACAAVVRARVEAKQYDWADRLVADAQDGPHADALLTEMGEALAACGEATAAARHAFAVRHTPSRISAVARTARALARTGLRDESRALLQDLPQRNGNPDLGRAPYSSLVLAEVFQAWSALGERGRARAVASEALRLREVGTTLHTGWRMVRALMRAGLYEQATWFVRSIADRDAHGSARRHLAQAFAEAGRTTAALNWARPLDDYPEAAVALVPVVDPTQGRALTIHALQHGEWQDALPAVLHLEPAAVPYLVEAFRQVPIAARTSAPSSTRSRPASPAAPASPPP